MSGSDAPLQQTPAGIPLSLRPFLQEYRLVRSRLVGLPLLGLALLVPLLLLRPVVSPRPASAQPQALGPSGDLCPPLPPPSGPTVRVSSEAELRDQAYNAAPGTAILVEAGLYHMQDFVHLINDGVALRGETGDRGDVILDFGGMETGYFGILVDADDVTIADLTIRNARDHGVSIQGRDRPVLYNLHIQDIGDQLVKVNPAGNGSEDGLLACSRLEYTTAAPDEYTNGISAHDAHRWVVRDNEWLRIRTPGNSPVPAILFWSASSDTVVERNLLVDCAQGIAFGNASHGPGDHFGGVVRNNMIYASLPHDVVIEMVHAEGWLVAHNTALLLDPAPGLTWGMEARFADSQGTFAYNLTNMDVWPDRDGAQATLVGNVTGAQAAWFVDAASADLHLLSTATEAIDRAAPLAGVTDDFDGDARPIGPAPDVGADEYGQPPPAPVTDLRVTQATTATGVLSATLAWTPPAAADTIALRYAGALIDEITWPAAVPLSDTLPGGTAAFTAVVPFGGDPVYFALKSHNAGGGWSALSNNAFWPRWPLFLPIVIGDG